MTSALARLDRFVTDWLAWRATHLLCLALGIVFLWFGVLKFFPGLSPAEGLIEKTVGWIVDPHWFIPVLGGWECAIGLGLLLRRRLRFTLLLLGAHMAGTFLPLVVCPENVWTHFPYAWTLEGQYIVKNLVLIGAGLAVAGGLRRPVEVSSWKAGGRSWRLLRDASGWQSRRLPGESGRASTGLRVRTGDPRVPDASVLRARSAVYTR